VTYGDISPPGFISGSFRTQLIDCSELDITEYDGEYLPGRAEMVIGGQTERVMAGSLFCSEIYELQEFPVGILALGGVMELYDDLELYWEGPYTGLVITEEVENFDEGVKYTARLIQDVEAFIEFTQQNDDWTISDIQDMSVGVYVEYSDIGELFTNGIVTDLEDRTIANFHASTLNCN